MAQHCPISLKNIDSNLFVVTKAPIFANILLLDFTLRALRLPQFSPFVLVAKAIIKLLRLKPQPNDEAPKRFALFIGLFLLIVVHLFLFFGLDNYALFAIVILIVCAFLEAFFNYCIGYKVYWLLKKMF
jgi:hypothetical protein